VPIDRLLTVGAVAVLLILTAIGLLRRRYAALCWSFLVYLFAIVAFDGVMISVWDRVDDYAVYAAKETILDVLKFAVALEIWRKSFASFPRARVRVGLLLGAVLVATAIGILIVPKDLTSYYALLSIVCPRQKAGSLALFAVVVSGAWWYRIPLHPLHRAILFGFAAYLTSATLLMSLIGILSDQPWVVHVLSRIDAISYLATCVWWASAAWRTSREPSPVLAKLQPWAHSW
jgi:hypothetical protein